MFHKKKRRIRLFSVDHPHLVVTVIDCRFSCFWNFSRSSINSSTCLCLLVVLLRTCFDAFHAHPNKWETSDCLNAPFKIFTFYKYSSGIFWKNSLVSPFSPLVIFFIKILWYFFLKFVCFCPREYQQLRISFLFCFFACPGRPTSKTKSDNSGEVNKRGKFGSSHVLYATRPKLPTFSLCYYCCTVCY